MTQVIRPPHPELASSTVDSVDLLQRLFEAHLAHLLAEHERTSAHDFTPRFAMKNTLGRISLQLVNLLGAHAELLLDFF